MWGGEKGLFRGFVIFKIVKSWLIFNKVRI